MSHVQARPAVWFSQNPERLRSRRWPSPRVTGHLRHSHVSSPQIADSALRDGQMQLSPTAAHISHSGVQLTAPQMSTRSGEHHTVR